MDFDPLSDRINDRRDREIELVRAECNRLASDRDRLEKENARLRLDLARALLQPLWRTS